MSHHIRRTVLPFTAIIGQDEMKLALLLNAINPAIGGVLIRGEKGTAKSTAVRALAALLPEILVVEGCPFSCDPAEEKGLCDHCHEHQEAGGELFTVKRQVRVVDLPLGVTEDRVVGTIDMEAAIKKGIKRIEPGILADANRGILYIDEVNLLDDHVADVLLDAAALGVNVVEREGISFAHPSRFILIGTMNPEEGEIRPQLLDRFGLQVTVEGLEDVGQRMEIVRAAERFRQDPDGLVASCEPLQTALREQIAAAQACLRDVTIDERLLRLVVEACIGMGIRTHRAEITVVRTARTIAAFEGRTEVTEDDVREAMTLALPHRMRRKPFEEPRIDRDELERVLQEAADRTPPEESSEKEPEEIPQLPRDSPSPPPDHSGERGGEEESPRQEQVFGIGDAIDVKRLEFFRHRDRTRRRRLSGRRVETLSAGNSGRHISSRNPTGTHDYALDATIRAAAPYQGSRDREGLAVAIRDEDLRERVRAGKVSTACVFVVDASGSMGAMKRMSAAKGAVLSMLTDSYQHRDRVGLVAFRGDRADLLLPLCASVDLAQQRLSELPTGGKTPLSSGLMKGMEVLLAERRKNEEVIPLLVLISDGRANVGVSGNIRDEVFGISEEIRCRGIHAVVIDTEEPSRMPFALDLGYCREIARYSAGRYYRVADLSPGEIARIATSERDGVLEKIFSS